MVSRNIKASAVKRWSMFGFELWSAGMAKVFPTRKVTWVEFKLNLRPTPLLILAVEQVFSTFQVREVNFRIKILIYDNSTRIVAGWCSLTLSLTMFVIRVKCHWIFNEARIGRTRRRHVLEVGTLKKYLMNLSVFLRK